jgi:hypothetical protein
MTMKHTPGPWEAIGSNVASDDGMVAITKVLWPGDNERDAANARLIAAAPELLAACRDALEVEEDMAQCPDSELAKRLRAAPALLATVERLSGDDADALAVAAAARGEA